MLILNGTVFVNGRFEKKDIRITDGKFAEIAEPGEFGTYKDSKMAECEKSGRKKAILDATGKYILPGLVDVHTHGREGSDFSRIMEEDLKKLLFSYAECGVTSVLGTTMTNEPSGVEQSIRVMGEYIEKQKQGKTSALAAKLLGIHMEGPFLGTEKKGAHDAQYLRKPDWDWFEKVQNLSGGNVRLVTIDPCLDGAEGFIKKCRESDIKVSLGHTTCGYETAVKARQAGADHVTHLFNAMNPLHHREPGLIGAAIDTGMYTELICDGMHVHPAVVRMMFTAHPNKVVLISDSIPSAGMRDGVYESGGLQVTVTNGKAVLADSTIAGSSISLYDAMVNAITFGVAAEQAVNSVTYLPAKSIGMEETVGSIAVGRTADFLVVNQDWTLENVYLN